MQYINRFEYLFVLDGDVYVYKYEKCKFDQPFLSFQPKQIFIGKSKVCEMTEVFEANDSSDSDGNTIFLECGAKEYVYTYGFEIFKVKTDDKNIDYISLTSSNMCLYAIMVGENYTTFVTRHYSFIENDKIKEGILLNTTNNNLAPFLYHLAKCGKDSLEKLEGIQIHSCWPHDEEEDENDEIEVVALVEEDEDLIETTFVMGTMMWLKILFKSVLYVTKEGAFTPLDNTTISVFASNVITIKVILIY